MESITLKTIKETYEEEKTHEPTPELQPLKTPHVSSGNIQYTIIVKEKDKKFSQVYTGSCCEGRLKKFMSDSKKKEEGDSRGCVCIIS